MSGYLGDFAPGVTIRDMFNTSDSNGASITRSTDGTISVYKDGGTTQSTSGVTSTEDFDSLTGVHLVAIDTSADGTFYSAGSDFIVVLSAATIDTRTVNAALFSFSLNNRTPLRPTTAGRTLDVSAGGEAGIDWANVGSPTTTVGLSGTTVKTATDVEADTADIQSRLPAALVSGRIDASVGAMAANTVTASAIADNAIDAGAIAADAITAAKIADGAIDATTFAAGAIDAAAIATDAITAAKIAANAIGASELAADAVTEIQAGLATAAALDAVDNFIDTEIGAIVSTLGTPPGASLAADIAAIEAQTDDIGAAGAGLTAVPWNAAWDAEVQSEAEDALAAVGVTTTVTGRIDAAISTRATPAQVNTEADTALSDVGLTTTVTGRIDAAVSTRATPAQVNTEILDCLVTDTHAEVSGVPAATSSLKDKLNWLFALARNRLTQTSTTQTIYADDASTPVATSTVADNGTTASRSEWS